MKNSFEFLKSENKNNLIGVYPNENLFENKIVEEFLSTQTKITWFLSGGIKNNHPGAKSEASIMKSHIDNYINIKFSDDYNINWDFFLDELSTNTAENFIRASDFLNKTTTIFDSIYIVTSDFHYKRASMMINLIDPSRQYNWILGDKELYDSRRSEEIHIQNVHSDISKAFRSLKI